MTSSLLKFAKKKKKKFAKKKKKKKHLHRRRYPKSRYKVEYRIFFQLYVAYQFENTSKSITAPMGSV